jgi:hypothetical protein
MSSSANIAVTDYCLNGKGIVLNLKYWREIDATKHRHPEASDYANGRRADAPKCETMEPATAECQPKEYHFPD